MRKRQTDEIERRNTTSVVGEGLGDKVSSPAPSRSGKGAAAKKVEEKEEKLKDNQYKCEKCTYINTVKDPKDTNQAYCKMCTTRDDPTY